MFLLKHLKKKSKENLKKIGVESIKDLYNLSMNTLRLWYQIRSYIQSA